MHNGVVHQNNNRTQSETTTATKNHNNTTNLRFFQHTPGTYPRSPTNSLWRNYFHSGVCWGSLRNSNDRSSSQLLAVSTSFTSPIGPYSWKLWLWWCFLPPPFGGIWHHQMNRRVHLFSWNTPCPFGTSSNQCHWSWQFSIGRLSMNFGIPIQLFLRPTGHIYWIGWCSSCSCWSPAFHFHWRMEFGPWSILSSTCFGPSSIISWKLAEVYLVMIIFQTTNVLSTMPLIGMNRHWRSSTSQVLSWPWWWYSSTTLVLSVAVTGLGPEPRVQQPQTWRKRMEVNEAGKYESQTAQLFWSWTWS